VHQKVHRTHRNKRGGLEHRAAASLFQANYDAFAYPGGLTVGLALLKALQPQAIETAVRFLEADPWFHRSGYVKEELLRRLKHAALSPEQARRLSDLVIRSLTGGAGRVFRYYKNLAPRLDAIRIKEAAQAHLEEGNPETRRRAGRLYTFLENVQ
jgi:hypothetical protein